MVDDNTRNFFFEPGQHQELESGLEVILLYGRASLGIQDNALPLKTHKITTECIM